MCNLINYKKRGQERKVFSQKEGQMVNSSVVRRSVCYMNQQAGDELRRRKAVELVSAAVYNT